MRQPAQLDSINKRRQSSLLSDLRPLTSDFRRAVDNAGSPQLKLKDGASAPKGENERKDLTMKKWFFDADYLQACNCDYGCPCEFAAPPTTGSCHGVGVWRIERGKCGNVPLDGLCLAFAAHWPKAIHLGGGTLTAFVDE